MSIPQISEAELEVMKFLWERKTATSPQIIKALTLTSKWKPKTIQTLLTRLVVKGAVLADKTNPKLYIYHAAVRPEQYRAGENRSFINRVYDGSVKMMLAAFVTEQGLTDEERAELKALLERRDNP